MPATSQQGFSCAACIRATGAVDLLCTFADGACATRVGSERFSTTITAKANVVDFLVITEPPADSTQYIGKSCFTITTAYNCTPPPRGTSGHFCVGRIAKENLLLSRHRRPCAYCRRRRGALRSKSARGLHP